MGGRKMFNLACRCGSSQFADVVVAASDVVGSMVVDDAVDVQLLDFDLRLYEMLVQCVARSH